MLFMNIMCIPERSDKMSQSMITKKLHVEGMTCSGCETRIEGALTAMPGVEKAKAQASDGSVEIVYDPAKAKKRRIIHGHTPTPLNILKKRLHEPERKVFNIDAGCAYKEHPGLGNLVALDLDRWEFIVQENID
jgi:copper chaperone CopZ